MGLFLAVSAFRECEPEELAQAIADYAKAWNVPADPVAATEPVDDQRDVLVFPKKGDWTVVLWPCPFFQNDLAAARAVSGALATVASTVHVTDGLYWVHGLVHQGEIMDRFASIPDYTMDSDRAKERMREKWKGNPAVVATLAEAPVEELKPYLVFIDPGKPSPGKVKKDDVFDLHCYWVFTDFWRRVGIAYPADLAAFEKRLRFGTGFVEKLPSVDGEV